MIFNKDNIIVSIWEWYFYKKYIENRCYTVSRMGRIEGSRDAEGIIKRW